MNSIKIKHKKSQSLTGIATTLVCFAALAVSPSVRALDEISDLYDSPQALAMGNAHSADAKGHVANFYNPAGLAKEITRIWEFMIFALDSLAGTGGISTALGEQKLGMYHLLDEAQRNPDRYSYFRFNVMPAIYRRNFAFALLGSYRFAAKAAANGNVDVNAATEVAPSIGFGTNLAGNTIKIGVSAHYIVRNELNKVVTPTDLGNSSVASLMSEGAGLSTNLGLIFTLPTSYLPTIAIVWKDMFNTKFSATNYLNNQASGAPKTVPQSFNAAFSIHPQFSHKFRTTFSMEIKHIEMTDKSFAKRFHVGVQIEDYRRFFVWLGANQLYPTFGMGLRLPGGNLEVGTYATDVGEGDARQADRRLFMRYTLSF